MEVDASFLHAATGNIAFDQMCTCFSFHAAGRRIGCNTTQEHLGHTTTNTLTSEPATTTATTTS
jgi:hypothetical protein